MKNNQIYTKSNTLYQTMFDRSPVPIQEMDISNIATAIATLKRNNIFNIEDYIHHYPDFVTQLFLKTRIIEANQAMLQLAEADNKSQYLRDCKKILGNSCIPFFKKIVIAIFNQKDELKYNTEFFTFKGNKKYIEIHAVFHLAPCQAIINFTFIDVTAQKKAALKLQYSEHRYKQLFTNTLIGTAVTNRHFQFTEVNAAFCNMIGYSEAELMTLGFPDVTISEHLEESIQLSKDLFAGKITEFTIFKSYIRKNGTIFRAKTFVRGIYDEYGDFISSLASILDVTEQIAAEVALKASEQRHRLLFENALEGIIIYDIANQKVIDCNDKVLELFGVDQKEDFLNTPLLKYSPQYQPCKNLSSKVLINNLMQAMEHGRVEYEWMHQKADGRLFYTRKYDIRLNTDTEQLFISIIKDITEKKQRDNAFQLINNNLVKGNYQDSLNNLVLAIATAFGIKHVFITTTANAEMTKIRTLAYSRDGQLQDNFEINLENSPCQEIYRTKQKVFYENNLQAYFPNNQNIQSLAGQSALGYPLFSKSGELIGSFSLLHDKPITNRGLMHEIMELYAAWVSIEMERMEKEQALLKSETNLKNIISSTADVFYAIDTNHKLIYFNQEATDSAKRLFGATLKLNKPFFAKSTNLTKAQIKENAEIFQRVFQGETVNILQEFEFNDEKEYFAVTYSPMRQSNDEIAGCIVVAKNITTLRKTQQELVHKDQELKKYIKSNAQLENFAYVASHDLKAPIRTINSFARLLQKRLLSKLDEPSAEYLNFILSSSRQMGRLVDALLEYSRVNTQAYEFKMMDSMELVCDILLQIQATIKAKRAVVEIHYLPQEVRADYIKLKQLFQNLITNALKFHKPNQPPYLTIRCEEKLNFWQFSVADNGIGIRPNTFNRIFQLFGKLNSQSEYEGNGIGLAICKSIVEQHGGRIWLTSEYGKGTTFYFTIAKSHLL